MEVTENVLCEKSIFNCLEGLTLCKNIDWQEISSQNFNQGMLTFKQYLCENLKGQEKKEIQLLTSNFKCKNFKSSLWDFFYSLLLKAVSGEDLQDRTDRAILTPWVKFLWESYRQCLDLLRNNSRVESLYQYIAQQGNVLCFRFVYSLTYFLFLCFQFLVSNCQVFVYFYVSKAMQVI